jgi:hypothetical protein
MVPAGGEYSLTGDVVLTGADQFVAGDDSGARCKIHGNGFEIHGDMMLDNWTGPMTILNCDIDGLGVAGGNGMEVYGKGPVTIRGNTFSKCSTLIFDLEEGMSLVIQNNTLQKDGVMNVVTAAADSQGAIEINGQSHSGTKLFQGNTILRSGVLFYQTSGWLVGGDTPAEGNVVVGLRAGIALQYADNMTVRGNYTHTESGGPIMGMLGWNQVKNFDMIGGQMGNLVEHNVFRGLNWLVEMNSQAEFRYNLLFDAAERGWILAYAKNDLKIHHNVLIQTKDTEYSPAGPFVFEDAGNVDTYSAQLYNNTVDAGGVCDPPVLQGALVLHDTSTVASFRSNAMTNVVFDTQDGTALIRAPTVMDPMPPLLYYTDYNLFYNPKSPVQVIYGVGVAGKTMRTDPGFGYNDVPAGGAPNMQVDPKFTGPIPLSFPFSDDDLIARATTVCQVLAYYRSVYTPAAGSPLTDAGDPQEGAGNDIGAIGSGVDNPLDMFGRLCDPADMGHPLTTANTFKCTPFVGITVPTAATGITCVCDVQGGSPGPAPLALAGVAILIALARRRARPRDLS